MVKKKALLVLLGNQLFPEDHLPSSKEVAVFLAEDHGLCTDVRHHQQKILLFLSAMRIYAENLKALGYTVFYHKLEVPGLSYLEKVDRCWKSGNYQNLHTFEMVDKGSRGPFSEWVEKNKISWKVHPNPMFLHTAEEVVASLGKKPKMGNFYRNTRIQRGLLLDKEGGPLGGKWSHDEANRKKIPKSAILPKVVEPFEQTKEQKAVEALVKKHFGAHPGELGPFIWPVNRAQALQVLNIFLEDLIDQFGDYEDAFHSQHDTLWHSLLSPPLNMGLITPSEVIEATMARHAKKPIPPNCLEGFVRQIVGWREFIRGIYEAHSETQETRNYFNHQREFKSSWFDGTTGLDPLDKVIKKCLRLGWAHHIERLMVLGNLMVLCEIHPPKAHEWFMEMFVDSSEWVMGPNVYGMALFADGGIFATKPYLCGSNYLLKMGESKGEWCDTLDGLYWRFINKHKSFFLSQPRLSMMVRSLDRMKSDRREHIFGLAEAFLKKNTL